MYRTFKPKYGPLAGGSSAIATEDLPNTLAPDACCILLYTSSFYCASGLGYNNRQNCTPTCSPHRQAVTGQTTRGIAVSRRRRHRPPILGHPERLDYLCRHSSSIYDEWKAWRQGRPKATLPPMASVQTQHGCSSF